MNIKRWNINTMEPFGKIGAGGECLEINFEMKKEDQTKEQTIPLFSGVHREVFSISRCKKKNQPPNTGTSRTAAPLLRVHSPFVEICAIM
jgi:hypothetical protein